MKLILSCDQCGVLTTVSKPIVTKEDVDLYLSTVSCQEGHEINPDIVNDPITQMSALSQGGELQSRVKMAMIKASIVVGASASLAYVAHHFLK